MNEINSAEIIKTLLSEKVARNPSYSLRALARKLGVSHTYLVLIMKGKRKISSKLAVRLGEAMGIDHKALRSTDRSTKTSRDYQLLELDQFRLISEWFHIALLDFVAVKGFRQDIDWIADRLKITPRQAKDATERLLRLGLLEETQDGRWIKPKKLLKIPTKASHAAIRNFHRAMIEKSLLALEDPNEFSKRSITGTTMSINPARIAQAKDKIAKFEKELLRFLTIGECTELYQLNVQLFRLASTGEDLC